MTDRTATRIDPKQSVASIVIEHSECAPILQQLRIDFCCKGEQSLEFACEAQKRPVAEAIDELQRAIDERSKSGLSLSNPSDLSTQNLLLHIVDVHHAYLRKSLPFVASLAAKVARVHGEHNPRLIVVNELVEALTADLLPHLAFEEEQLFPAMGTLPLDDHFLSSELVRMKAEHLAVGALLARLRDEASEFTSPDWACTSYRTLIDELRQLELDTLQHVHLENHVLAPRFA